MKKLLATTALVLAMGSVALADQVTMGIDVASVTQLDPHVSTKAGDKLAFGMMFNGLVRFAPGSMSADSMQPDLAESWSRSDDGLTWTFKLREGVQFHAGYGELTSEDVVYSLQRAADPDRSGVASDYAEVDSVTAVDKYTVQIKLKKPIPSLLGIVADYHGGYIISKKAGEELGENFKSKPIGTGPYQYAEFADGQFLKLTANKDYFLGAPSIDDVVIRFIPSASARELAFRNGELDLISGTREEMWVERFKKEEGALVDVFQPGELRTLHLNRSIAPFDNIKVRQAVAHALNRDELIAFVGSSVASANPAPVPAGYLGSDSTIAGLAYDPEKAKALLAEAGLPDGFTTKVYITENAALLMPMQIIQAQLKKVGINVELEVTEHSAWHAAIRDNVSAMVLYGAARFPVADTYLTQFYHSSSIVKTPTAVTNFSHCEIADQQIDAARSEADQQKQLVLWGEAQAAIIEDVCSVPLFELLQVWGRSPKIDYGYDLKGSLALGPIITEATTKSE